ncbi:MAG TPA: acyl-CoA dehydrogenase family protein, partial [Enhygromyxa sp.]|nr:acyl-CoA dehydrogenase family protein [Enhygromyxa sp.]
MFEFPRKHPGWTEDLEPLRRSVRGFVEREISPFVDGWDEANEFPRELYRKAGEHGLLGIGFPDEY